MRGVSQVVSDAHNSRDKLCAATEMGLSTKVFLSEALGWQGILIGLCISDKLDLVNILRTDLELEGLALFGAANKFTCGGNTASDLSGGNFCKVWDISRHDDLNGALTTSIVKLDEEKSFSTSTGATGPSSN